jgi:hypothetical protein
MPDQKIEVAVDCLHIHSLDEGSRDGFAVDLSEHARHQVHLGLALKHEQNCWPRRQAAFREHLL